MCEVWRQVEPVFAIMEGHPNQHTLIMEVWKEFLVVYTENFGHRVATVKDNLVSSQAQPLHLCTAVWPEPYSQAVKLAHTDKQDLQ